MVSHIARQLSPEFPSDGFLLRNIEYAEANAGDMIVMNGLTYNSPGQNLDMQTRSSFNNIFAIPAICHRVDPLPSNASSEFLKKHANFQTGGYVMNPSLVDFLEERNA